MGFSFTHIYDSRDRINCSENNPEISLGLMLNHETIDDSFFLQAVFWFASEG